MIFRRYFFFFSSCLLLLVSCEKDPLLAFPGQWSIQEGGSVVFQENGSGYSVNAEHVGLFKTNYFENECDYSDTSYFYWNANQEGNKKKGTMQLIFVPEDPTSGCIASTTFNYDIRSNKKIRIGDKNLIFDNTMTLVRDN